MAAGGFWLRRGADGSDFNDFDGGLVRRFGRSGFGRLGRFLASSLGRPPCRPSDRRLPLGCRLLGRCLCAAGGLGRRWLLRRTSGRISRGKPWRISCAFSWTYAFLSSLSADQPLGYCGSCPESSDSLRRLGKFDDLGVWLQGIRRTTRPLVDGSPNQSLGPTTSNSINRGLAAMPAQERSIPIDGRVLGGDQLTISASTERQWQGILRPRGRIRVPRLKSRNGMMRPAGIRTRTRRRAHRARRLLSRSNSGFAPARRQVCSAAAVARRRTLGQAPGGRDRRVGGDLRGLFRRAVVAARRRSDQSRHGDAVACGGDRGKYRPRQYGRGRRHADRARRHESGSRCVSATSWSGIATTPSSPPRRRPR